MPIINPAITAHQPMTYATDQEVPRDALDCSLGINPYGCSPRVQEALREITIGDLSDYPHGTGLRDDLAAHWAPHAALDKEQIVLGNGSVQLLININRLFLAPGRRSLGVVPGFSAYTDDVGISGAKFNGIHFTPDMSSAQLVAALLEGTERCKPDLICLENPNNPTGQALELAEVEAIVAGADALGIPILVDEAYGDYLPDAQSAICLLPRYEWLMVTRTFSKSMGLAGFRLGYAAVHRPVAEALLKTGSAYDGNGPGRILARAALADRDFAQQTLARVQTDKARLLAVLHNIKAYPTHPNVPIMALSTERDVDLYAHLLNHGINAVPGVSFETIGERGVRLIVHRNIEEQVRRLSAADTALGK